MKYSLVNGIKKEAFPKGKGICVCCENETVAKCGNKKINHWAHKSLKHCDKWWENETEWHRKWKAHFPEEWQEVVRKDSSGEKHIADVLTSKGVVIEFQNSPMNSNELRARENFYKKMAWVVNGEKFKNRFYILDKLPSPQSELANNVRFLPRKNNQQGKAHFKISENPNHLSKNSFRIYSNSEIMIEIENNYVGHHLFDWVNARTDWYISKTNVYFDFGDEKLWKLIFNYDDRGLMCVKRIDRAYFIDRALGKI